MASQRPPKTYDEVKVINIIYTNESHPTNSIANSNAAHLNRAWKEYNYDVYNFDESGLRLKAGDPDESSRRAAEWFRGILRWQQMAGGGDSDEGKEYVEDEPEKLLIVCYFSHGGKVEATDEDWMYDHLYAHSALETYHFDLTLLQKIARDSGYSDTLFVLECCSGSWPGMEEVRQSEDSHLQETIAGNLGITTIGDKELDFSRRLAANLRSDRSARSVKERVEMLMADSRTKGTKREGYHRHDSGEDSIILAPL